jgi:hypothetical protein
MASTTTTEDKDLVERATSCAAAPASTEVVHRRWPASRRKAISVRALVVLVAVIALVGLGRTYPLVALGVATTALGVAVQWRLWGREVRENPAKLWMILP